MGRARPPVVDKPRTGEERHRTGQERHLAPFLVRTPTAATVALGVRRRRRAARALDPRAGQGQAVSARRGSPIGGCGSLNRVRREADPLGETDFWGRSFIADETGAVIAKASADREEIITASFDLAAIRRRRADGAAALRPYSATGRDRQPGPVSGHRAECGQPPDQACKGHPALIDARTGHAAPLTLPCPHYPRPLNCAMLAGFRISAESLIGSSQTT